MILIADSGATKTDWCLGRKQTDAKVVQTQGINPFHQPEEHIRKVLEEELLPHLDAGRDVTHIYFYGAGCTPEKSVIVGDALRAFFPDSRIDVQSDLLGAARALCGNRTGIACILGTGSNSCLYDGERIVKNVSPLGYILGDEGSGAYLGKRLVSECLKGQLSENISTMFLKWADASPAMIIDKVYRQPQANRYLASFTHFLAEHRKKAEIHELLLSCFTEFFRRNVMQYDYQQTATHFTGSIAWYFRQEVAEAAKALNIRTGKFTKTPINGLINYHFKDE